jgi:hypothetical protein
LIGDSIKIGEEEWNIRRKSDCFHDTTTNINRTLKMVEKTMCIFTMKTYIKKCAFEIYIFIVYLPY